MRHPDAVYALFPAARDGGLPTADVAASRERFGANRLTPPAREPVWKLFLAKFDEPIIRILLAASILKIVVDLFDASPTAGAAGLAAVGLLVGVAYGLRLGHWVPALLYALAIVLFGVSAGLGRPSVEGLAVMAAVGLAIGVSFLSEVRSGREFDRLDAGKDAARVRVRRDDRVSGFPLDEVVVGDVVLLEPGEEIPADGWVLRAAGLSLDQSLLTGESEPVGKRPETAAGADAGPDRPGCVYRGTHVVDGLGEMVVAAVGDDTLLGGIARRLGDGPDEAAGRVRRVLAPSHVQTPLQEKLAVLAGWISRVGYLAAAAIFVALLVRGAVLTDPPEVFVPATPDDAVGVARAVLGYVVYMVIVIVVAVPEGLPMSVAVSLALAARKMTRANALVRRPGATETIGSATVICTDKTGTLTRNRMAVERVGVGAEVFSPGADGYAPGDAPDPPSRAVRPVAWVALNAAANATAALDEKDGRTVVVGNSTEGALLLWLEGTALRYDAVRAGHPALYRVPFSSDRKRMLTVVNTPDGLTTLLKGAPEAVLARCDRVVSADGTVRPLSPADREQIGRQVGAAAADALRTLGFAHGLVPPDLPADADALHARRADLESGLVWAGFVALGDPLRDDAAAAIGRCRQAGIEVKLVTGDNPATAHAIARTLGLLDAPDSLVMTGPDFDRSSDEELAALLPRLRVLARASPLDKYRLVGLLKAAGHVVAVTGDGTNDAPALKAADVGLAMGVAGTEVAKGASQIILLDDAFGTIVHAVHWGRALYENIQRFLQFQLTINVSALAVAFLGPFVGVKPPFTVLQLLWINVIMDTFAAVALCSEPPRRGLMRVPPKRRDERIVSRPMLGTILATAGFFVAVMVTLLVGMTAGGWFAGAGPRSAEFPELTARQVTLFFTTYVVFQVWNLINCRSLTADCSGLRGLTHNPFFLGIAAATVAGQWLIVSIGGALFAVEPLGFREWFTIAVGTATVLLFAEAVRAVRRAL